MAIMEILKYPDQRLRVVAKEIDKINNDIKKISMSMIETMYHAKGIGLAATQVGIPIRLFVIDIEQLDENPNPIVFINPKIILSEGREKHDEGCLSIPGYTAPVERASKVIVKFLDLEGNSQELIAEGLLARAIQHENDHLDGKLFIDRLSPIRKELIIKKLKKEMEKSL
ncbi:MAG: peptide deformylase [Proteobacteria bacterium]|nr:peptide deformylase [Pseudomonadota bacterium]